MLKLVNASKFYRTASNVVTGLRKVNLELGRNEFVAIVGESGSGKTTLLNVLSGNDRIDEGEMYIDSEDTSAYTTADFDNYRQNYVGFVYQNYNIIDSFSALDNVLVSLTLMNYEKNKRKARAIEILKRVGLGNHIHHKASKLSGGQKQRLVIARALAKDTPIIACDEPTGNLDSESGKKVMELLSSISKEKLVIVVTHNYAEVEPYATRKIKVSDGEVVEDEILKKTVVEDINVKDIKPSKISFKDKLFLSIKSLLSTPKKNIFTLIVFFACCMLLGSTYGSFMNSLDDSSYGSYCAYNNTYNLRMIANKKDGSSFNSSELQVLDNDPLIGTYTVSDLGIESSAYYYNDSGIEYLSLMGYGLPITLIDSSDLIAGRMPKSMDEVVLVTNSFYDEEDYSDYLNLSFKTYSNAFTAIKPVGITTYSKLGANNTDEFILYTEDALKALHEDYYFGYSNLLKVEIINTSSNYLESIDVSMLTDTKAYKITNNTKTIELVNDEDALYDNCKIVIKDLYSTRTIDNIKVECKSNLSTTTISKDIYDEIYKVTDSYQISIFAANKDKIKDIESKYSDYNFVVPSNIEAQDNLTQVLSVVMIILAMVSILANIAICYLLTYAILRGVSSSKAKQYLILRSIGADKKLVSQEMLIENFIIAIVSYLISIAIMISLGIVNLDSIYHGFGIMEYIILFAMIMFLAFVTSNRLTKYLFKHTLASAFKEEGR